MKKCKLLLLLCLLLVLCGCNATYKIKIKDFKVYEELELLELDSSRFDSVNDAGWSMRSIFDSLLDDDMFSEDKYTVKSLSNDTQLGVKYKSNFDLDELKSSSIINQCYDNVKITEDEENIYINSGNDFTCYEYYEYLDLVTIKLQTNHEVVESNASLVNGKEYIWEFDELGNKEIILTLSKVNIKNNNLTLYLLIALLCLVVGGVAYYIYTKNKSSNKF